MDKVTKDKLINILESVFLTTIFIYAVLGSNNITYGRSIITPFMWFTFILGVFLLLYRLVNIKLYIGMTAILPMFLMVFSICLSTLVNRQYHLKQNLIICIYWFLYFFLLYNRDENTPIKRIKKTTCYLSILLVTYITVGVLISFWMLYTGVSEKISVSEAYYEYYQGFAIGRLWGIFINPNNSAVSAAIVIALLIYFIDKYKNIFIRVICLLDMGLMILFVALTDSRTGSLCIGIVLGFFSMFGLIYRGIDKNVMNRLGYGLLVFVITFAVGITSFGITRKTKDWYNHIVTAISLNKQEQYREDRYEELLAEGMSQEEIEKLITQELQDKEFEVNTVDRGYDLSKDLSNRRIDAWKSGMEIFVSSPRVFIFGTTFKGFSDYAIEHIPETYIVNNDYGRFTTLDNEIINIMVAQGLIGLIALLWMLIALFYGLFRYVFKVRKEDRLFVVMLTSVVFALAGAAMFSSVMFYHFSQNTIFFWVALGSLLNVVKTSASEKFDNEGA